MTRFLPAQLKLWTKGELFQTCVHTADPERYYPSFRPIRARSRPVSFLPLKGDKFDGHDFLEEAIKSRPVWSSVSAVPQVPLFSSVSVMTMTHGCPCRRRYVAGLWDMAKGFRTILNANIIGVTGSVGKTTTRRMIYQMITSQVKPNNLSAILIIKSVCRADFVDLSGD